MVHRCNLLENNEKPTKFFLNLEKAKNNIRSIKSLKINNKLIFSQTEILEHQKKFYSSLYSNLGNGINNEDLSAYLDKISIPQISNNTKIICDDELTLEEIQKAVKSLALNKTPGIDGLPVEFYRVFGKILRTFYSIPTKIPLGKVYSPQVKDKESLISFRKKTKILLS